MSRGTVWRRCTACGRKVNGDGGAERHRATGCAGTRTSWAFQVTLGRDQQGGRQQVMRAGFATAADADRALRALLTKAQLRRQATAPRRTLAAFLDEWLDATAPPRVVHTTHAKRRLHVRYVTTRIGDVTLERVTAAVLDQLYASLARSGRLDCTGGLAPATVRDVHRTLSRAFADAVRWQYLDVNPCTHADPPPLDQVRDAARATMHAWTAVELRRFLDAVASHPRGPLFHLAAATGMRCGEVCGLHWSDVDLDRALLRVARQMVRTEHGWQVVERTKSAAGGRVITLDTDTVTMLHRLRAGYSDGITGDVHGPVFARDDGTPEIPTSVSRAFRRTVDQLDVPRVRLHDLRHTHATLLLQSGVPVQTVSSRLGHAKASITLGIYSHLLPGDDAAAAARYADLARKAD